jgi:TolA-binding protein
LAVRAHSKALLRRPARACAAVGSAALLFSCAAPRAEGQVDELRGQLQKQADLIEQQKKRIDQLELRVAELVAASVRGGAQAAESKAALPAQPAEAKASPPAQPALADEPPKKLHTVKLLPQPQSGRRLRERHNPVERAPRLPLQVELREPDESALAELDTPLPPPPLRGQEMADRQYAEAVGLLNGGDYLSAQTSFLSFSFAARHPHHAEAGSALGYAALARAASGDCEGALASFDRALHDYPRSASAQVILGHGRCLLKTGRRDEARRRFGLLIDKFPGSTEAAQAEGLLTEVQ